MFYCRTTVPAACTADACPPEMVRRNVARWYYCKMEHHPWTKWRPCRVTMFYKRGQQSIRNYYPSWLVDPTGASLDTLMCQGSCGSRVEPASCCRKAAGSPGVHVEVSLHKIMKPKRQLAWQPLPSVFEWITVSRFGQKLYLWSDMKTWISGTKNFDSGERSLCLLIPDPCFPQPRPKNK